MKNDRLKQQKGALSQESDGFEVSEIEKISRLVPPVYDAITFKSRELNNLRLFITDKPIHL